MKKINPQWQDPETGRFKKGNPGRPKNVTKLDKIKSKYVGVAKEVIKRLSKNEDLQTMVKIILFDMVKNYSPKKFEAWLMKPKNETLFYTKILPRFFPAHLDIQLSGDVSQKLTYELILPHLLEAKEKGLLKVRSGEDGKYIDFDLRESKGEAESVES